MEDSGSSPSGVTGEPVDISGLSFTATYSDGATDSVVPSSYTPTSFGDTVGTQTVTFSFEGTDITVEVDYDVEAPVLTGLSVSGGMLVPRALNSVNTHDQVVTATYSNGTTKDVTADATCVASDTGTGTWGEAVELHTDHWETKQVAYNWSYTEGGVTQTANSIGGWDARLLGQYRHSSASEPIELENTAGNYVSLVVFVHEEAVEYTDPFDGVDGGYLIEGANAGDWVWMTFTKDQYDNDTAVDITTFGGLIPQVGAVAGDTADAPSWGTYIVNNRTVLACNSVDGTATATLPFHLVSVFGKLANNIDPQVGVKKSDFVTNSETTYENAKVFYVDLVSGN